MQKNWYQEDYGTNFGRKQNFRQPSPQPPPQPPPQRPPQPQPKFEVKPTPYRTTPEIVSFSFGKNIEIIVY